MTGSAGFVGRHMVDALQRDGWAVRAVDIANPGTSSVNDVRSWWRAIGPTALAHHWDLVVHCAAVVGGIQTIEGNPLELACNDLAIDAAFFDWCRRAQPRHVVYFSSCAAYSARLCERGHPRRLREDDIDPTSPEPPQHTYGQVKLQGEQLAMLLHYTNPAVSVHVVRPFSGYGEDQADSYPFPAILARAMAHEDPLTVWGNGQQVRDWVHIDDVVGAALALVDADLAGPMNVCTGSATTMVQLAQLMAEQVGYSPSIATALHKPNSSSWRVGDPTLMRELWTPEVTLERGIARSIAALTHA